MKRILLMLAVVLLVACASFAQQPIYYNSTPEVFWTPAAFVPDGTDFLPGDTVEYRIYVWDVALLGFDPPPALGVMDLRVTWLDADPTSVGEESQTITFQDRRDWGVAVMATHIDGGGNRTDYSDYIASSRAADTASGIPFVYIPVPLPGAVPSGSGLRDSGT